MNFASNNELMYRGQVLPDEIMLLIKQYWPALNVITRLCKRMSATADAQDYLTHDIVTTPGEEKCKAVTMSWLPNGIRHGKCAVYDKLDFRGNPMHAYGWITYDRGSIIRAESNRWAGYQREIAIHVGSSKVIVTLDTEKNIVIAAKNVHNQRVSLHCFRRWTTIEVGGKVSTSRIILSKEDWAVLTGDKRKLIRSVVERLIPTMSASGELTDRVQFVNVINGLSDGFVLRARE